MLGADPEYQQQVAVFRYGVIADLLQAPPDAGSLAARIRAKTEQSYVIPHSSRTRIGKSTVYGWLQQYLQGGFDALMPKRRSDQGRARRMPVELIRVIDDDQGKSGSYSENRSGFRDLMARIGAGEVGIVLVLEVSRLARDNADWHQLLRLASITDTLILYQADVYDPNDGNDRLLLGFKGTISEFELQGIRARMAGG